MKKKVYYSMHQHPGLRIPIHEFGPSMTQPDEALSIEQILARVSHGLTTGLGASVSDDDYDDPNDEDFDDPTLQPGFDKLDALELATSEQTRDLEDRIDKHRKKSAKNKEDEEFKKRVDEEVQKRVDEEISKRQKQEEPQE